MLFRSPFELPEIESKNDPEVSGYLEISETGQEGTWKVINHNTILPVSCNGWLLRLHASNSVGDTVSDPVRLNIKKANIDVSGIRREILGYGNRASYICNRRQQ